MVRIRQTRLASYVAVLLLVSMYIAPMAGFAAKREVTKPVPVPVKTVVVFPFADEAKSSVEDLPANLANSLESGLNLAVGYRGMAFSDHLPSMMRAMQELTLKAEDMKGPFGTDKPQIMTAVKIAHEMVADYVLVGTIDEVKADVDKKTAEVTVSAVLADGTTGETIKTFAVTGVAPVSNAVMTQEQLVSLAAGNAVTQMVKDIAPQQTRVPATAVITNSSNKNKGLSRFILPFLLAVGIGIAVSHGGGNSSHDGGMEPPPGGPF